VWRNSWETGRGNRFVGTLGAGWPELDQLVLWYLEGYDGDALASSGDWRRLG
jgi:hypothetical protein